MSFLVIYILYKYKIDLYSNISSFIIESFKYFEFLITFSTKYSVRNEN